MEVHHDMRLAQLTMCGFKSFADRTVFRFDDPIIGIVGPNGCGKSNVVDAIKWVLGERSAKSLRGEQMMDVIFGGTVTRKPAYVAEVILTFENPIVDAATGAREMSIETELVEIGRRLNRDGASAYLINGKKARLKDIRDIFLDTGIGADAYSIIEQGKVDSMLTSNPIERRTIFEEAAGVAKFKVRRIEAQRKLDRTETNLVRCREQLDSAERRLKVIKRQAEKAREFKALDVELVDLRQEHAFDTYYELRERIKGLTSEFTSLDVERATVSAALVEREDAKQEAELERHSLQTELRELEETRMQRSARRDQAQQRADMAKRARDEAEKEIQSDQDRLAAIKTNLKECDAHIEEQASLIEQLQADQSQAEQAVKHAIDRKNTCEQELNAAEEELAQQRAAVAGIEREQATLTAQIESIDHRIEGIREQIADINKRREDILQRSESLTIERDESRNRTVALATEITTLEQQIAEHDERAQTLDGAQREINDALNHIVQDRERQDSRRHTLQEMQEAGEGLGEAVRTILDKRESGEGFAFVRGILADHIETDSQHAFVIEAALGSMLQSILIDRASDVLGGGKTDLAGLTGRVTFLPMDSPTDNRPNEDDANQCAYPSRFAEANARPLMELVRTSAELRPLVRQLLQNMYLVPGLEAASFLARQFGRGSRFITPTGQVLNSNGRIVAGPNSAEGTGAGILIRRTELATLESNVSALDAIIDEKRIALADIDQRAADLEKVQADLQQRLYNDRSERDRAQHVAERLTGEIDRLERDRPLLDDEAHALDERIAGFAAEQNAKRERLDSLARLLIEQRDLFSNCESNVDLTTQALQEISDVMTDLRIKAGQTTERYAAAQRERRQLEASHDDALQQQSRLESALTQRGQRIVEHDRIIDEAAFETEECAAFLEESAGKAESWRNELEDISSIVVAAAEAVNTARERMSIVDRNLHAIELSKREAEVKREELEQRTIDDLNLDLCEGFVGYEQSRLKDGFEAIDRDAVGARISELRKAIKKLGNVNLDAIDEEEAIENRHDDLRNQVIDLDEAREQLDALIAELNDASRDRFKETFEAIREQFASHDGMFRKLFGGGKADIILLPDAETGEVDWLESGVEIMAKPPGKEPRSISLLSGGEKTMTSVALLMSIFQSKPSPFCILDEVDAALDDANVQRFAGILRTFLDKSHFIVITHNKNTMQAADQLYGITMQERGISTRVSVRFDDVGQDGRISDAALRNDAQAKTEPTASSTIELKSTKTKKKKSRPAITPEVLSNSSKHPESSNGNGNGNGNGSIITPTESKTKPGNLAAAFAKMREVAEKVEVSASNASTYQSGDPSSTSSVTTSSSPPESSDDDG